MGRLTKTKVDEIVKLRKQNYTQKEAAEKLGIHVRTVRKYDPLREQKSGSSTTEQVKELEEDLRELVAGGFVHKNSEGRFRISFFGKRTLKKFQVLQKIAVLEFLKEEGPVKEEEVERFLDDIDDELFDQATAEVKRRWGFGRA